VPGWAAIKRLARFVSRKCRSDLRLARGTGLERDESLFDAKHSPELVLRFSRLGTEQKDWPEHTEIRDSATTLGPGNAAPPHLSISNGRAVCLRWDALCAGSYDISQAPMPDSPLLMEASAQQSTAAGTICCRYAPIRA